jgi:hypothetical protein
LFTCYKTIDNKEKQKITQLSCVSESKYKTFLFSLLTTKIMDTKLGYFGFYWFTTMMDCFKRTLVKQKSDNKLHMDDDLIDCVLSSSLPITRSKIIKHECVENVEHDDRLKFLEWRYHG